MTSEKQYGLGFSERAICDNCWYASTMKTLFEETLTGKKGRSTVVIKKGLQGALSQMPTGNSSVRKLFLYINIPPPLLFELQKCSNQVYSEIYDSYKADMAARRDDLKLIYNVRGNPTDVISIKDDGLYNSMFYSGLFNQHNNESTYK